MSGELVRDWASLRWRRLIAAALLAPLPALYIGFAAFVLSYSDRNIYAVLGHVTETGAFVWAFSILFTFVYLNVVARFRGRVGMVECIAVGTIAVFLLALGFFVGSGVLDLFGPLPYMVFFPGVVLGTMRDWHLGAAILGSVLAPAGALSGWIFWRIGIAPAVPRSKTEVF
ncbi:MAG: hypothetical protein IPK59_15595 [Rhodospirillaceae bacterium]|nr:hypothetical protein [Rhodospirillaceae bacterium]